MSGSNSLVAEIQTYCAAHANPKGKTKWERYFKEGFDAWGLLEKDDPLWTVKQPEWAARYAEIGLRGFAAGVPLFASGKYEEGALAVRFVKAYVDGFDDAAIPKVAKWFESGIANWAHTDVLCSEILSPRLVDGKVTLDRLAPWRASTLRFQRRAVPVSLLGLIKNGAAVKPLLEFVKPMMLDPERVVHQGLGWFLREAWKKDPKPVEAFLLHWKDRAARLIFQYATEKMTAQQKSRYRRAKSVPA